MKAQTKHLPNPKEGRGIQIVIITIVTIMLLTVTINVIANGIPSI